MNEYLLDCIQGDNDKFIYIVGNSGYGKTYFIKNVMTTREYDYQYTSLYTIKNEESLDKLINSKSVMKMFSKSKHKYRYLIIDDIDHLSNYDKKLIGIIYSKMKSLSNSNIDVKIILLGINESDKRIKDIMKM